MFLFFSREIEDRAAPWPTSSLPKSDTRAEALIEVLGEYSSKSEVIKSCNSTLLNLYGPFVVLVEYSMRN